MTRSAETIYDELLVLRCQNDEAEALEELIQRWQPRLLRHARYLTQRDAAAWDVLQEAMLALVRGIGRLDDPARFKPWAFRIVTHKAADWTRRRQRRRRLHNSVIAAQPTETDSNDAEKQGDVGEIQRALQQLPSEQRALLNLYYAEELSVRNIADVLGIPAGTVKSRLHHAREQIRTMFEHGATDDE